MITDLNELRYLRFLISEEVKAQHRSLMLMDFRRRALIVRPDGRDHIDAIVKAGNYLPAKATATLLDGFLEGVRLPSVDADKIVDLLIIVPKPIEQLAAQLILNRPLGEVPHTPHPSGRHIFTGELESPVARRALTYKLVCLNRQNNVSASVAVSDILQIAPARLAALVGMAAGHPGKVTPPDVVTAEHVFYVSPGTKLDTGDLPEPQPFSMPARVAEDLGAATPQFHGWHESYRRSIDAARAAELTLPTGENCERMPQHRQGVLLSIEQKVELTDIGSFMEGFSGDAKALDMEAGGFAAVCNQRGVNWVVFRGVSDFGRQVDDKGYAVARDKSWQLSAAMSAMTCFVSWISEQSTLFAPGIE